MVSRILCIMAAMGLASGAVWQGGLPVKPKEHAHKQGCYIEELNDVIPFGTMVSPIGHCFRVECSRYGIEYASCGLVQVSEESHNCFLTETDLSRPYPDCCPDVKCEHDNYLI
ncbi:uncharacterized protein LOC112050467 [Bicyclus anynana]|uniref:Uncharacterized protein LOC112050467 n=1 Tax=Bicyclus anynana TaxID=110368 RepID=A0A6J1NHN7_BICAN|nr:uncharacterized protein LOC112050467 [Bicyclus anynana]